MGPTAEVDRKINLEGRLTVKLTECSGRAQGAEVSRRERMVSKAAGA